MPARTPFTGVAMRLPAIPHRMIMDRETRLKRLRFRAWHRGTKEADLMIGGFYDHCATEWDDAEIDWFEAFLDEQDVDIMAWAMKVQPVPARWQSPMMDRLCRLDFVRVEK
jgi:antitoxin CptB